MPPKVSVEELLRLAREALSRVGVAPVEESRALPWVPPTSKVPELEGLVPPILDQRVLRPLDVPPTLPRPAPIVPDISPLEGAPSTDPTQSAADAMTRVINNTVGRYSPSKIVPEGKSTYDRVINPADLRHQLTEYVLNEQTKNPNKPIEKLVSAAEPSLARWIEQETATLSGEPSHVAAKRRLAASAGQIKGGRISRDPRDPEVLAAQEWLRREGLQSRPEEVPLTSQSAEVIGGGLRPDEVLAAKEAGEALPLTKVQATLNKIHELIQDPKILTPKQRQALSLHYGLGGGEGGELSLTGVGKVMSISDTSAAANIKGALKKLKTTLEKAGLSFEKAAEPLGPPTYWPRTTGYRSPEGLIPSVMKEPVLPRMASEGEGSWKTPSLLQDIFGRPVAKPRSGVEIKESTELVPPPITIPKGLNFEEQRKYLREKLQEQAKIYNPSLNPFIGEPSFPLVPRRVQSKIHVYEAPKASEEPPIAPEPSKPALVARTRKQLQDEFHNTRATRYVPDPNGDVEIGGQRFKKVEIEWEHVRDPKTGKLKRILKGAAPREVPRRGSATE